jgi:co-chaperonin GroES (HSP10)
MENTETAKPIRDRVFIEIEKQEKSVGGIILPETAQYGENKLGKEIGRASCRERVFESG